MTITQADLIAYAKAHCLDCIEYYNKLAEQHVLFPAKRDQFIDWSQSKQADLIAIQEMENQNLITIDIESELDAHGLRCEAPHLAKEAIEIWLRNEIADHITEMLDAHKVYYSEF